MKYSLRSLLIVLAAAPPILALAWWATRMDWPSGWEDSVLLAAAILCAVPYWGGLGILLARNYRQIQVWFIAIAAALIFPGLFFMSIMQLMVAIPVWVVIGLHGTDLEKPISTRTASIAIAATIGFLVCVLGTAMLLGR
jgi:hypothetical protein